MPAQWYIIRFRQDLIGQAHLVTSLVPLLSNLVRPDKLSLPAGKLVSIVSALSLLGGGIYWQEGAAVSTFLLLVTAKICDRWVLLVMAKICDRWVLSVTVKISDRWVLLVTVNISDRWVLLVMAEYVTGGYFWLWLR